MSNSWYWPLNDKGGSTPWKIHSGTSFRKAPFRGLVREVIQNSKDWPAYREEWADGSSPVSVSFELVELNREHIPGIDAHLISQLEKCLQKAKKRNNRDDADGINQAIQCLKQSTIVCLHVSDSGTTGMSAEIDDPQNYDESPFGKYMVCEDSDQDDRGGSHGQENTHP